MRGRVAYGRRVRRRWKAAAAAVVILAAVVGLVLWIYDPGRDDIQWGEVSSYLPVIALVIAGMGLSTWRRQLRGTHDFELARGILKSVYALRNAVAGVRSPLMSHAEAKDMPDDASAPWQAYAYQSRWDRVTDAQEELGVGLLEAEVVWDDLLQQDALDLRAHVNRLNAVVRRYLRSIDESAKGQRMQPMSEGDDAILYDGFDPDDPYTARLNELVGQFEAKLKKKLTR